MSSEVTIGKQNSGVTKTTRPVTLKDAPPHIRERLRKEEQAEIASQIGTTTSSPIEQKLEWFCAYHYGKYNAGRDEESALQCLKEYVSLRSSHGENRFNIWQELLHGFIYGNEILQADRNDVEWLSAEIYKDTDILDNSKTDSLIAVFRNEGINNMYTEALLVAKNNLKSIRFWFSHDPFYPFNWLCIVNALVFLSLLAMGFVHFFPFGLQSTGFVSKYSVLLAGIAIPLNLIYLCWNYKVNKLCEQISSIPPHPSLNAVKSEMDKRKLKIKKLKKDDIEIYGTPDYIPATIVVCALLLFFGVPKAEQYERYGAIEHSTPSTPSPTKEKQSVPVVAEDPRAASISVFRAYHENITKRNFKQAYAYLDQSMQDSMSYDGWAAGFQTTLKSDPYDIKVVSESPEQVVLAYTLHAVDNPGGEKTFDGKAVVVKTENGWKINDIENAMRQSSAQQAASVVPAEKPQNTNISSNLALGGISIGNSADTIFKKLGKPSKQENKGSGMMYYYYPSVEVHCLAGHVVTLVSNSPQAKTSKGIHEGSPLADVLSLYGNNYSKFQYDSDEMYEYEMGTNYGKPMLLRFAVKNGRVDYISIRRGE